MHMADLPSQDPNRDMRTQWENLEFDVSLGQSSGDIGVREGGSASPTGEGVVHAAIRGAHGAGGKGHHYQMALLDRVYDAGRLITIMDHRAAEFQQVIEELKSDGGPGYVATAKQWAVATEQRAIDLQADSDKLMA
ncbi:hypothetical protein BHE74_00016002 [Ensete ventricosum]|nr:hypothetical protein BHE74_00016002 [Ensete ventricosum]